MAGRRFFLTPSGMTSIVGTRPATRKFGDFDPCPDCAFTDHPGRYIGMNETTDCDTCHGTAKVAKS